MQSRGHGVVEFVLVVPLFFFAVLSAVQLVELMVRQHLLERRCAQTARTYAMLPPGTENPSPYIEVRLTEHVKTWFYEGNLIAVRREARPPRVQS